MSAGFNGITNGPNCESATESLIEAARRRREPDASVRAHLGSCAVCADFFQEQQSLTSDLRLMRIQSAGQRSPDSSRRALLKEFESRHRRTSGAWLWRAAAAAVLLLSVVLVRDAVVKRSAATAAALTAEEQLYSPEEGFIEVPYAPPLAQGELVRVVHTELQPAELASLGMSVDPLWSTDLPADLLVGQDGFPRAVRVSNESSAAGGF